MVRMSAPALVILAAGVGSRYGGPKQIEPLGPGGATLLDYSVYDARRTGFAKVVVVTRPELAAAFERLNATVALPPVRRSRRRAPSRGARVMRCSPRRPR